MTVLAIDAGNTRIKFALYNSEKSSSTPMQMCVIEHASLHKTSERRAKIDLYLLYEMLDRKKITCCIGCCVAGKDIQIQLENYLQQYGLKIQWIKASENLCGLRNTYTSPTQLGADRFVNLVSAWHQYQTNCLVVSAGTAMTIDALNDQGVFIGGVIIPGLHMMQSALLQKTAEIQQKILQSPTQADFNASEFQYLPLNTQDAVFSGALMSLAGAIDRLRLELDFIHPKEVLCVMTGGDAELIKSLIKGKVEYQPYLLLNGLYHIAKACYIEEE